MGHRDLLEENTLGTFMYFTQQFTQRIATNSPGNYNEQLTQFSNEFFLIDANNPDN
jgi:hypothetical protein